MASGKTVCMLAYEMSKGRKELQQQIAWADEFEDILSKILVTSDVAARIPAPTSITYTTTFQRVNVKWQKDGCDDVVLQCGFGFITVSRSDWPDHTFTKNTGIDFATVADTLLRELQRAGFAASDN